MSNKPTHTPGPWWRSDKREGGESVYGADGILVADCCIGHRDPNKRTQEINQANARLVAAAPALLAALEEIDAIWTEELEETTDGNPVALHEKVRAAIGRAVGQEWEAA